MIKVTVLMGGVSSEREVSISSGKAVSKALKIAGYDIDEIVITNESFNAKIINSDITFIALHGRFGEDGKIQKILEDNNIIFTGSSSSSCRLSFNKFISRELLSKNNIKIPLGEKIKRGDFPSIDYPLIIKPPTEGSSVGCHLVKNEYEFSKKIKDSLLYSSEILVEEYIPGREITAGIISGKPLPLVEIIPKYDWYDFDAKYKSSDTKYIVPAEIEEDLYKNIQKIGIDTFNIFNSRGFGRVDFRLSPTNEVFVLELNSIPGFTKDSLLPKAAAADGINFTNLCDKLIKDRLNLMQDVD